MILIRDDDPIVEADAKHLGDVSGAIDPEITRPADRPALRERAVGTGVAAPDAKPASLVEHEGVEARFEGKVFLVRLEDLDLTSIRAECRRIELRWSPSQRERSSPRYQFFHISDHGPVCRSEVRESHLLHPTPGPAADPHSFHRDAFRQVAWLIDVAPLDPGDVVSQELEGDDGE